VSVSLSVAFAGGDFWVLSLTSYVVINLMNGFEILFGKILIISEKRVILSHSYLKIMVFFAVALACCVSCIWLLIHLDDLI